MDLTVKLVIYSILVVIAMFQLLYAQEDNATNKIERSLIALLFLIIATKIVTL